MESDITRFDIFSVLSLSVFLLARVTLVVSYFSRSYANALQKTGSKFVHGS